MAVTSNGYLFCNCPPSPATITLHVLMPEVQQHVF